MNQNPNITFRFRDATAVHIVGLLIALGGVIMLSTGMGYIKIPVVAVAKRAGKPEDLPWQTAIALRWDRRLATIEIRAKKTGCNPSSRSA